MACATGHLFKTNSFRDPSFAHQAISTSLLELLNNLHWFLCTSCCTPGACCTTLLYHLPVPLSVDGTGWSHDEVSFDASLLITWGTSIKCLITLSPVGPSPHLPYGVRLISQLDILRLSQMSGYPCFVTLPLNLIFIGTCFTRL